MIWCSCRRRPTKSRILETLEAHPALSPLAKANCTAFRWGSTAEEKGGTARWEGGFTSNTGIEATNYGMLSGYDMALARKRGMYPSNIAMLNEENDVLFHSAFGGSPLTHGCVWKWLVPLNPMVLLIIIPIYPYEKWLFHWEYTQHFQTNPHWPTNPCVTSVTSVGRLW